jgi:hypothetical protein
MAKNITDNFAQEVKPWQLRHFFNLHICNLDNIDSFYQYYYENILMQQPADFLYHNLGVYSLMSIEQSTTGSRNRPKLLNIALLLCCCFHGGITPDLQHHQLLCHRCFQKQ